MKTGLKIALGIGGVIGGYFLIKSLGDEKEDTSSVEDQSDDVQTQYDEVQGSIAELFNDLENQLQDAQGDAEATNNLNNLLNVLNTLGNSLESSQATLDDLYELIYLDDEGNLADTNNLAALNDLYEAQSATLNDLITDLNDLSNSADIASESGEDGALSTAILDLVNTANSQLDLSAAVESYLNDPDSGLANTLDLALSDYFRAADPDEGIAAGEGFGIIENIIQDELPGQVSDYFVENPVEDGVTVQGEPGASAYEVWLAAGNSGNVDEFLDSLEGGTGASAYEIWLNQGNVGTEQEFLDSLEGGDGPAGDSVYQVWLSQGNVGTEQEFLDSLEGGQGEAGDSAYQVWLSQGNQGTPQEFLDSLQGEQGLPGESGADITAEDLGTIITADSEDDGGKFISNALDDIFVARNALSDSFSTLVNNEAAELDQDEIEFEDAKIISALDNTFARDVELNDLDIPSASDIADELDEDALVDQLLDAVDLEKEVEDAIADGIIPSGIADYFQVPNAADGILPGPGFLFLYDLITANLPTALADATTTEINNAVDAAFADYLTVLDSLENLVYSQINELSVLTDGLPEKTTVLADENGAPILDENGDVQTITVAESLNVLIPNFIDTYLQEKAIILNDDGEEVESPYSNLQTAIMDYLNSNEGLTLIRDQISASSTIGNLGDRLDDVEDDIADIKEQLDTAVLPGPSQPIQTDLVTLQDFINKGQDINFSPENCNNPYLADIFAIWPITDVVVTDGVPTYDFQEGQFFPLSGEFLQTFNLYNAYRATCLQSAVSTGDDEEEIVNGGDTFTDTPGTDGGDDDSSDTGFETDFGQSIDFDELFANPFQPVDPSLLSTDSDSTDSDSTDSDSTDSDSTDSTTIPSGPSQDTLDFLDELYYAYEDNNNTFDISYCGPSFNVEFAAMFAEFNLGSINNVNGLLFDTGSNAPITSGPRFDAYEMYRLYLSACESQSDTESNTEEVFSEEDTAEESGGASSDAPMTEPEDTLDEILPPKPDEIRRRVFNFSNDEYDIDNI